MSSVLSEVEKNSQFSKTLSDVGVVYNSIKEDICEKIV